MLTYWRTNTLKVVGFSDFNYSTSGYIFMMAEVS